MRYATANIMALPVNHEYEKGIHEVLQHSDMVGWQEMTKPEYWNYLTSRPLWGTIGRIGAGAAITYRKAAWTLEKQGDTLLHPGTPAICLERRIVWGVFHRTEYPNLKTIMTTRHYVSKAWNHRPDPDKELRKGMWLRGNATDLTLLRALIATGIPSVHTGDCNRMNYPIWGNQIGDRHITYAGGGGIDYLAFINGKDRKWETGGLNMMDIPGSDHRARIRTAHMEPRNPK